MHIHTVIEGTQELAERFDALNEEIRKGVLIEIVSAAADLALLEIRPNAPVAEGDTPKGHKPGTLKARGIGKALLRKSSNADQVSMGIGFTKKGWYGIFSELGTAHQGARPFVVPGFERKRPEIFRMMGNVVARGIASWKEGGRAGFFKPRAL